MLVQAPFLGICNVPFYFLINSNFLVSGDEIEVCEDSLREILPSCPHRHISRTKREAQEEEYEYTEWCRDEQMNIVHRCAHRTVTCAGGCPLD